MPQQSCNNCRFYGGQRCQRHAPVRGQDGFFAWPQTVDGAWCGDWEAGNRYEEDLNDERIRAEQEAESKAIVGAFVSLRQSMEAAEKADGFEWFWRWNNVYVEAKYDASDGGRFIVTVPRVLEKEEVS